MSLLVAAMEWRVALARRRLLLLNVVVPLILVTPIAAGAAPAFHAAAVYTVLFALFGTFGSAIPLVRDAETGLFSRVIRAGVEPSSYLIQRAAAGSTIDAVQLMPALAVATVGSASTGGFLAAALTLWGSLWVANLLGNLVAAVARSLAETALFGAVAALLMLHFSGVFRTPSPGSFWASVEAASPFQALHETMLGISMGTPSGGTLTLVVWGAVLPLITAALARPIGASLRAATSR